MKGNSIYIVTRKLQPHIVLCRSASHLGKVFITQYKYTLIVAWTKTSQPSSLSGCATLYFWSMNSWQTVHPPGTKEKLHNNVHAFRASELWVALAISTLHFLQCIICGWQMVFLSNRPWSKGIQIFFVSSFSFLFSFLFSSFNIRNYTQLLLFTSDKTEAQKG